MLQNLVITYSLSYYVIIADVPGLRQMFQKSMDAPDWLNAVEPRDVRMVSILVIGCILVLGYTLFIGYILVLGYILVIGYILVLGYMSVISIY